MVSRSPVSCTDEVGRTASFRVNISVGTLTGASVGGLVVVPGVDAVDVDVNIVGIAVVNFCAISIIDGKS